jgi:hypothetical protein
MQIQTIRTWFGSHQIVDSVIELKSLVKVLLKIASGLL